MILHNVMCIGINVGWLEATLTDASATKALDIKLNEVFSWDLHLIIVIILAMGYIASYLKFSVQLLISF